MKSTWTLQAWPRLGLVVLLLAMSALAAPVAEETALKKKALGLNDVTGEEPITATIVELLEDENNSKKLIALAMEMVKAKDQPFNINATWILARTAHGLKDAVASEKFYRLHIEQALKLESGQKLAQGFTGLIQLLFENKKFEESEKVCQEFLELDAGDAVERRKPLILRQMILIIARQGEIDKANNLVERLLKADPDNPFNLELKARVLREADKLDEAAKVYEDTIKKIEGIERLPADVKQELINDFRYTLSGVYVEMKQVNKAADQLKSLLEKDPDNPTYNNDLGYIWADHDMNLDESEKLIRKALEEDRKQRHKANPNIKPEDDKDNPAYLDSLGWVLFKKKQYKEAKKYLEQAVEQEGGRHLEIYDHLGDVHMILGEKEKAIEVWKKGIEATGDTKREKDRKVEVEKKLKEAQK
jgi:tetratricopeptide (TPR) repeat protein